MIDVPEEIVGLINKGALFIINDSAGKDSQAMKILLLDIVPPEQLVIVHANLRGVEWEGNLDHIKNYAFTIPVFEVTANKTFFEMVYHRGMFPSPTTRQCTSDLKRGPIQKFINNYAKLHGFQYVVNCLGLRAEESSARKKKIKFQHKPNLSAKHRTQYEWLPIHGLLLQEVWDVIADAEQQRHYAYDLGMKRLSCKFCIMGCDSDLKIAAKHDPVLAMEYMIAEEKLNFTMSMSRRTLKEIINS